MTERMDEGRPGQGMEWNITIHRDLRVVEVVTRGIADKTGSLEMAKVIARTMRGHRYTRCLIDHRAIEQVTGSVTDIYQRPKLFRLMGMILGIRIAEVIRPEHYDHFHFFETVCVNRGYRFSIFHDRQSALEWLLEKYPRKSRDTR